MVLGPLRVTRDGAEIDVGPPLQRTLLAALLVDVGRSVSVPVLIDRLWGHEPPATATKSIQKYVSSLRGMLGHDRIVSHGGYRLAADPQTVDSVAFESAVAAARALPSPAARASGLDEALAYWHGEPFSDLPEPLFLEPVRRRLEEARLTALEDRLTALLEAGDAGRVAVESGELVATHPLRERLWQLRMAALAATGRQAEALREYQRLRHALGDEMGIEPSAESALLEERILLQQPTVERPLAEPGNLPAPRSSLIAREVELAEVGSLLERSRLVTLVGPGGVGKTSLALEAARRNAAHFAQGAWLTYLGPVADPERLAGRVAESLGVSETPGQGVMEGVRGHLKPREALLVMDNCEHLVETAASMVADLLGNAPRLTVLATSRRPLAIAGETVLVVDPLPVPSPGEDAVTLVDAPAMRLLVTRATEAGAHLGDLEAVAPVLADICRRLDGIPLALELAAARLRALGPGELAARIAESLPALGGERRDLPDRQRTLEATIEWSYRLLDEAHRALFVALAVFRGGFTLEAAEQVCEMPGIDVAEGVAALVDRSLVQVVTVPDGSVRYHLLRTIRQFAHERLAEVGRHLAGRHAAFYAELVGSPPVRGAPTPERSRRITADYENIRAALEHLIDDGDGEAGLALSVALGRHWSDVGALGEAQTWLERALTAAPGGDPALRVRALLAASAAHQPASSEQALRASAEAAALAERIDDPALLGEALCSLGRMHAVRVERDPAVPLLTDALAIFEALDDRWGMAQCHEALGVAHRGPTDAALTHYRRAVALYREIGVGADLPSALFSMAYRSLIPAGRYGEARAALEEAAELSTRFGMGHELLHAKTGLGQVARVEGDLETAKPLLGEALDAARAVGDRRCTVRMLTALGAIAVSEGEYGHARRLLSTAAEVGAALDRGLSSDIHELMDAFAMLAWKTGAPATAARWFGTADTMMRGQGLLRSPSDQTAVDAAIAALGEAIGADVLARLLREGASLSFDGFAAETREMEALLGASAE